MPDQAPALAPPSTFVSVTAWIFVVPLGLGVLMLALQNLMLHTLFAAPEAQRALINLPASTDRVTLFLVQHLRAFAGTMLAAAGFALMSAIGLLLRRNGARLCFIGALVLGTAHQLASLACIWFLFTNAPDMPAELQRIAPAVQQASTVMVVGLVLVLGWLIAKLCSPAIRAEFQPLAA